MRKKNEERLGRKKQKIAALSQIMNINKSDRLETNGKRKNEDADSGASKKVRGDEEGSASDTVALSDDQYKQIKREIAQKTNELKSIPNFRLRFFGEKADFNLDPSKRQPLLLDDLQHLLLHSLLGNSSPYKPDRWCRIERVNKLTHSVVLVIEGLSSYHFSSFESVFIKTKNIFAQQLEIHLPKFQQGKIMEELSCVPLTQSYKEKLIENFGSLEAALLSNRDHLLVSKSVFPIESDVEGEVEQKSTNFDKFPRTRLLLSPLQMMMEGFPIPIKGEYESKYRDFKLTRSVYKPVNANSPLFGVDCEMCRTVVGENELARVSIVNEDFESVYETLVRPDNKITNYLTQWSGITADMMENVTKTLKEVQEDVFNLLPADSILVGQSLNCDLNAMKLMHPYVIDTSVIFNATGDRNRKTKLSILSKHFLDEEIQQSKKGHSSIEDSLAALKLVKLKLSKNIYYGDLALQNKRNIIDANTYSGIVAQPESESSKESREAEQKITTTIFSHANKRMKKSAIITSEKNDLNIERFYSKNGLDKLNASDESKARDLKNISHHKVQGLDAIISKTKEIMIDNDFNLSYINLQDDHDLTTDGAQVSEDNMEETVQKVDKWINKLWKGLSNNGMFVVVFGGTQENNSGLAMVRVKSDK